MSKTSQKNMRAAYANEIPQSNTPSERAALRRMLIWAQGHATELGADESAAHIDAALNALGD